MAVQSVPQIEFILPQKKNHTVFVPASGDQTSRTLGTAYADKDPIDTKKIIRELRTSLQSVGVWPTPARVTFALPGGAGRSRPCHSGLQEAVGTLKSPSERSVLAFGKWLATTTLRARGEFENA